MFFKKEKKYFSVEETAAMLGKSVGQIDLYIWLNKIPNVQKINGAYLIPKEEVYILQDQALSPDTDKNKKIYYDTDSYDNESFSYL